MEKIHQAVNADGLQIPLVLMQKYGLGKGSDVTLELGLDGILILPARLDQAAIENRALRYVLSHIGEMATIEVHPLPDENGWEVLVYGVDQEKPAGKLIYSPSGALQIEVSTSPTDIRQAIDPPTV
ncbi:MAG: hypothetical protein EXR62_13595 [Chloroflexi bacterium]|nr:hypothetical protein [Chloroflexota bacterium]